MEIAEREDISTEATIHLTVLFNNEFHRFRAVVYESTKYKFVTELTYLDKYDKPLKNSEKRKIKEFIKTSLMEPFQNKCGCRELT